MRIHSNIRDYDVHFSETAEFLAGVERFSHRCYVVDSNVWSHHRNGCLSGLRDESVIVLPVDEDRKNLGTVQELYDRLTDRAAKRNLTMITIGGGTLQDISGFAASTLYRGIQWILVPTTLLAQADSCIGSKTSLNYKRFKNLIGTFYPPSEVHIHTPFLATLKEEDFYSGLGEVLKLYLMGGKDKIRELTGMLSKIRKREPAPLLAAIKTSLSIKQDYISGDEFDTGRRNLLNFGHCFGHALETTSNFAVPHGQAVLAGIIFANIAARNRRLLTAETHEFLLRNVLLDNLVARPRTEHLEVERIYQAMKQDKKRMGEGLALVMLKEDLNLTKVVDYDYDELSAAVIEMEEVIGTVR